MTIAKWYMTITAEISKTLEIYKPTNGFHEHTNGREDLCGSIFVCYSAISITSMPILGHFFYKNVHVKN